LPRTAEGIVPESCPAGRLVSEAPEPEKVVAARTPVDGINVSLELETLTGLLPDVAPTQAGYTVVAVATSSVVAAFVELVAVVAVEALPLSVAVIVPAEKLPEASRATSLEAVLADVASAAIVTAAEPLYEEPVR
jgi:hypothetical protein